MARLPDELPTVGVADGVAVVVGVAVGVAEAATAVGEEAGMGVDVDVDGEYRPTMLIVTGAGYVFAETPM